MALLDIIPDSNPIMRKTSKTVKFVDEELRQLVSDMYDSMVANWGIGLAAIQVGVRKRFFIYEIPKRDVEVYEACHDENGNSDDSGKDPTGESSESTDDEIHEPDNDPGYTGDYTVCINPRIISREGAVIDDEGCLSKAGWVAKVERAYQVTFQAYDLNMEKFERTVTGLEARCIQHETDHLDGILFTDRALPDTLREIREDESEEENGEIETVDTAPETTLSAEAE